MRTICRIFLCLAILSPITIGVGVTRANAADAIVTDVRVGHHTDKTRFVMEMSRGLQVNFFMLDNPYRIVLDFGELGWQLPAGIKPGPTGLFKAMRYGLYKPGQTRVVVETSMPTGVQSAFYLSPIGDGSQRLVLDLVPITRQQFLTSLNSAIPVEPTGVGYASDVVPSDIDVAAVTGTPQPAAPAASVISEQPVAAQSLDPDATVMTPKRKPAKRVVVLDAGHGGADPGTIGGSGVYEKHITVAAARIFKTHLENSGRYTVVLTRDRDIFIPLRERVAAARRAGADLFVSIHADSIKNKKINGASVYTLSEKASDREAALLAEKENKADIIGGMDFSTESQEVANILIDLAQREAMNESKRFAGMLVKDLQRTSNVLSRAHRSAGFAVLKAPDVPSVLVELGFLSNARDEKNLRSKAYLRKIAQALLSSTDSYFDRVQQANVN
jgi:N-acetylmuramoyl-L-alanine amidase